MTANITDIILASSLAEVRARNLLWSHLDAKQRTDFERHRGFEVTGAATGRIYWLSAHSAHRVTSITRRGNPMTSYGVSLSNFAPLCDHLLAQKLALEDKATERRALSLACKLPWSPWSPVDRDVASNLGLCRPPRASAAVLIPLGIVASFCLLIGAASLLGRFLH